ncbi:hypothetical protein EPJ79_08265 [Brachyspira aalborgi]|uniref:Cell surface protein n=1 Tax=Brachyspira aalborgi TaxID=29522 RepID=A0A5C8D9G1_9SPIR|nr:hypothetical protein [Brachyspira aalborgi]TXJ21111.1 hypothetical protein EPJ79_08265 [Brachyspira aalborgi]
MKHTKNILKSLLIMVMALSLLAVSCSKDEGGSKPTNPAPSRLELAAQAVVAAAAATKVDATEVKTKAGNLKTAVIALKTEVNKLIK